VSAAQRICEASHEIQLLRQPVPRVCPCLGHLRLDSLDTVLDNREIAHDQLEIDRLDIPYWIDGHIGVGDGIVLKGARHQHERIGPAQSIEHLGIKACLRRRATVHAGDVIDAHLCVNRTARLKHLCQAVDPRIRNIDHRALDLHATTTAAGCFGVPLCHRCGQR